MSTLGVDRAAVERRVEEISRVMAVHAGAIELLDVAQDGAVRVRFTGMCQGCPMRPLTMLGTIEPALMAVPGITTVSADGARVSTEAAERMRTLYAPWH
jgi:Fe-S cluster biogenesis protein NfuA